ncbi:hypothetical protein EYF80_034313 [Liparis tanakae]|uniref:Uncharacterized protein n=1 Tax=Liparis tanakae TaxID=230148 RepID=A0A4Z2GQB6_9TELE|nr:hypothetical protein EYF80_034313 [Liparis tanakae]
MEASGGLDPTLANKLSRPTASSGTEMCTKKKVPQALDGVNPTPVGLSSGQSKQRAAFLCPRACVLKGRPARSVPVLAGWSVSHCDRFCGDVCGLTRWWSMPSRNLTSSGPRVTYVIAVGNTDGPR